MTTRYIRVNRETFAKRLAAAQAARGKHGLCVSEPEPGASLYVSLDGLSGYALQDGAYMGSVFSQAKGRLEGIVQDAIGRATGSYLELDCFAGLERVYARHGFKTTGRAAFDWQYAPDGWTHDMGEPDLVFMAMPLQAAVAA